MSESLVQCQNIMGTPINVILDKMKEVKNQEDIYDLAMMYAFIKYGKIIHIKDDEYTIQVSEEEMEKAFEEFSFEIASYIGKIN